MTTTSETCSNSKKRPRNDRRHVAGSGWPHGRIICDLCGNAVLTRADGTLRQHKPRHIAESGSYAREMLGKFQAEHADVVVPDVVAREVAL